MTRGMKKPFDVPFRKAATIISKINNSLPLFSGGTPSQISDQELVGPMEWLLLASWRAKFDLDSYIPTLDTKVKLVSECEAIERNELINKEWKMNDNKNNNKFTKKAHKIPEPRKILWQQAQQLFLSQVRPECHACQSGLLDIEVPGGKP